MSTTKHSVWIIFPAGTNFCFIELVHNLTAMWNEDTTAIPGTAQFNCSLLQRLKLTAWECFKGWGFNKAAWHLPIFPNAGKIIKRAAEFNWHHLHCEHWESLGLSFLFIFSWVFWGVFLEEGWVLVWFDLLLFSSWVWLHILVRLIGVLIESLSISCSRCPILKALIFWHCRKPFTLTPQLADQRSGVLRRSLIYSLKWVARHHS